MIAAQVAAAADRRSARPGPGHTRNRGRLYGPSAAVILEGIMTEQLPTGVTELAAARHRKATAPTIHADLRAWAKGVHTTASGVGKVQLG